MAIIPTTLLGTSDPVSICKGFALIPEVGTVRAGIHAGSRRVDLFDVPLTRVLTFRLTVATGVSFFIGVCGPAYGIKLRAGGEANASGLRLVIAEEEIQAGLLYGINFAFRMQVSSEILGLVWREDGWNSRFEEVWHAGLNVNLSFEIDALGLVTDLILGKLVKGNKGSLKYGIGKVAEQIAPNLGVFNIFGIADNALSEGGGSATIVPEVDLPTNILAPLKLIPEIGQIIAAIEAAAFQLSIGLVFSIGVPIEMRVNSFSLDDRVFQPLTWGNNKTVTAPGSAPANPSSLGVSVTHALPTSALGFTLRIAAYVTLTFVKVFNVGATTPPIAVPDVLRIRDKGPPVTNTLSNRIGRGQLGFDPLRESPDAEDYEVVFELPAVG